MSIINDRDPIRNVLVASATAGFIVDTTLFPVDTIKSRLQTGLSFQEAGGFKNVYRGITPILLCSVPSGALFFCTYEMTKRILGNERDMSTQMIAGVSGEIASCCFRTPFEVVKIRAQTGNTPKQSYSLFSLASIKRSYAGFLSTVMRDVPFSLISMPIWEQLKLLHQSRLGNKPDPAVSAIYGGVAGAISGFMTNPLDVVKTRIMISKSHCSIPHAFSSILKHQGLIGYFAGVVPRVTWITTGGLIFFGSYEKVLEILLIN